MKGAKKTAPKKSLNDKVKLGPSSGNSIKKVANSKRLKEVAIVNAEAFKI